MNPLFRSTVLLAVAATIEAEKVARVALGDMAPRESDHFAVDEIHDPAMGETSVEINRIGELTPTAGVGDIERAVLTPNTASKAMLRSALVRELCATDSRASVAFIQRVEELLVKIRMHNGLTDSRTLSIPLHGSEIGDVMLCDDLVDLARKVDAAARATGASAMSVCDVLEDAIAGRQYDEVSISSFEKAFRAIGDATQDAKEVMMRFNKNKRVPPSMLERRYLPTWDPVRAMKVARNNRNKRRGNGTKR